MVAAEKLPSSPAPVPVQDADGQRFIMFNVTWEQYAALRKMFDERPGFRLTFLEGTLELMSPSRAHEGYKKIIARLLEIYGLVSGVRLHGFGSTTYQNEQMERALEPDECYCVGDVKDTPDIALEVALSSGGISKLEVYRGLGVPEVWIWKSQRLHLFELVEGQYQPLAQSKVLPDLDLDELSTFALMDDQAEAARAYFERLQQRARR
ncbi:MAG: Uma2 family endonuclease [Myxococcota bacterium]